MVDTMTLEEALDEVLANMGCGVENRLSRDDIRELCQQLLGYWPRGNKFEEAFVKARIKHNVIYKNNLNWIKLERKL